MLITVVILKRKFRKFLPSHHTKNKFYFGKKIALVLIYWGMINVSKKNLNTNKSKIS